MVHPAGLEPTASRSAAWRSSSWAMGALKAHLLYEKYWNCKIFFFLSWHFVIICIIVVPRCRGENKNGEIQNEHNCSSFKRWFIDFLSGLPIWGNIDRWKEGGRTWCFASSQSAYGVHGCWRALSDSSVHEHFSPVPPKIKPITIWFWENNKLFSSIKFKILFG